MIAWMANLGTLRYHPWPVKRLDTERVDQLRIDLDPQPGTDFVDAARAAQELAVCSTMPDSWVIRRPVAAVVSTCSFPSSQRTGSSRLGMR